MLKKIGFLFVLLLCTALLTTGICEAVETLNLEPEQLSDGTVLLLEECELAYLLPYNFERVEADEVGNIMFCFYRQNPVHMIVFSYTDVASLEEAEKLYEGRVNPHTIQVNGMDGVDFLYATNGALGKQYCVEAYIDNGNGQIILYYEVTLDANEGVGMYENRMLPVREIDGEIKAVLPAKEEIQPAETAKASEHPVIEEDNTAEADSAEDSSMEVSVAAAEDNTAQITEAVDQKKVVLIQSEGDVNVRAQPDASSEKVGVALANSRYKLLGISDNGWYLIEIPDDISGYVSPKVAVLTY